jgi:predicted DNA-binding ribbon-helix-helix protein
MKSAFRMKSAVVKRSVTIGDHRTSVSLESEFWNCLKAIADSRQTTLSDLVGEIDTSRENGNLSSALRVFVLSQYCDPPASPLAGMSASGI